MIAAGGYVAFKDDIAKLWENLHVRIAEYPQPKKTVWLDQNISKEKLSWFYHADQGTRTFGMPYEWFMALEQPTIPWLVFTDAGPFSDPAYLDRYGFIPDTIIPGKKALPIGIAQGGPMLDPSGAPWRNPRSKQDMTGVGLTCAACHTGRFTYKDTAVIVDGGPALTDLFKLKQGMGVALLYTRLIPTRFDRFAERILGQDSAVADRETLKYQIDQVLTQLKAVKNLEEAVASQSVLEGYGRLDALNRIGNQVFSIDLKKPENYAGSSAPVHYPRIWNTPWFDWVQYNGSIMQPMVRNAGESLGVSAELNLTRPVEGPVQIERRRRQSQRNGANDRRRSAEPGKRLLGPEVTAMAERHPAGDRREARGPGRRTLQGALSGMSPAAGLDQEPFFDFNNKDWWTKNEVGQPVLQDRKHPDRAYRHRSRPGGGHDRTERSRSPRISASQETDFADALRLAGREDRQRYLRPAETGRQSSATP